MREGFTSSLTGQAQSIVALQDRLDQCLIATFHTFRAVHGTCGINAEYKKPRLFPKNLKTQPMRPHLKFTETIMSVQHLSNTDTFSIRHITHAVIIEEWRNTKKLPNIECTVMSSAGSQYFSRFFRFTFDGIYINAHFKLR